MRFWRKLFARSQQDKPESITTSQNAEELISEGNSLKGEGKYSEAVKYFKQVLTSEPRNEKAWFFLADTYTWARDYGRALACLEQVLALSPNNAQAKSKVQDMKPVVEDNPQYRFIYMAEKSMFSAISRFNFGG